MTLVSLTDSSDGMERGVIVETLWITELHIYRPILAAQNPMKTSALMDPRSGRRIRKCLQYLKGSAENSSF